jgi:3-oxoacyl-[acyl-carrier protein] reductase
MLLEKKTALVTGASRGIGKAIALEMAREGADVIVNYSRSDEKAEETVRQIDALGRRGLSVRADVSQPDQVEEMRGFVVKKFGGVDVLVNNAGIHNHLKSWEIDGNEWKRVLGVDLDGVFHCSKAFMPEMKERRWGRIVNISSIIAFIGTDHEAHYCASKAGVIGLTKSLALELASFGITVNAIAPGMIETDMTSGVKGEARKQALALIPLGRMGQPADIAHVATFLASDRASFVTGQTIHVNGGEAMY